MFFCMRLASSPKTSLILLSKQFKIRLSRLEKRISWEEIATSELYVRARFSFRLAVLALSSAACVAYLGFHAYHSVVWSNIGGLAGSALVREFVELIGSFVEMHVQFIAERNRFLIMV